MNTRNYEEVPLSQVIGDLIACLMAIRAFGITEEIKEETKPLLQAYIANGGKNPKAAELLTSLEGK